MNETVQLIPIDRIRIAGDSSFALMLAVCAQAGVGVVGAKTISAGRTHSSRRPGCSRWNGPTGTRANP